MISGKPVLAKPKKILYVYTFFYNAKEIGSAIDFFAGADSETLEKWSKAVREFALKSVDTCNIKRQYLEMFGSEKNSMGNCD